MSYDELYIGTMSFPDTIIEPNLADATGDLIIQATHNDNALVFYNHATQKVTTISRHVDDTAGFLIRDSGKHRGATKAIVRAGLGTVFTAPTDQPGYLSETYTVGIHPKY